MDLAEAMIRAEAAHAVAESGYRYSAGIPHITVCRCGREFRTENYKAHVLQEADKLLTGSPQDGGAE